MLQLLFVCLTACLHLGKDMMIEADVSLGTIKGKEGELIPIMAHPPSKQSDLSLEEFLDTILDYQRPKGIKLDFKNIEVVESSLKIVKLKTDKVFRMKIHVV
jgi:hypothetical protein